MPDPTTMPAVTMPRRCRMFCANRKPKLLAGPVIDRDGEGQDRDHQQAPPERPGHGIEHRDGMPGLGGGHGEPLRLLDPAADERQQGQGMSARMNTAAEPDARATPGCARWR